MSDDPNPQQHNPDADATVARWGRWLLLAALLLVAIVIGYGKLHGGPWMSVPAPYQANSAPHYCVTLAGEAQGLSYKQLLIGWVLVAVAALAGVMGGVLGSPGLGGKALGPASFLRAYRGVLLLAAATLLTAAGQHFLDRSAAATQAAMTATDAIVLIGSADSDGQRLDRQAYELCVRAKSEWLGGRTDYSRIDELTAQMGQLGGDQNGGDQNDAPPPSNGAP